MPVCDILPAILLVLNSFLLPILLSCGIYLILIIKKKKLFKNKVENETPVSNSEERLEQTLKNEQTDNNSTINYVVSNDQNHQVQINIQTIATASENHNINLFSKKKENEKVMAQVSAAERSIKTNLFLGTIFIIAMSCSIFVADQWRNHFYTIVLMSIRGTMPILTAIANFGTVKNVALNYWNKFEH
jgi:hypothetical protein